MSWPPLARPTVGAKVALVVLALFAPLPAAANPLLPEPLGLARGEPVMPRDWQPGQPLDPTLNAPPRSPRPSGFPERPAWRPWTIETIGVQLAMAQVVGSVSLVGGLAVGIPLAMTVGPVEGLVAGIVFALSADLVGRSLAIWWIGQRLHGTGELWATYLGDLAGIALSAGLMAFGGWVTGGGFGGSLFFMTLGSVVSALGPIFGYHLSAEPSKEPALIEVVLLRRRPPRDPRAEGLLDP